MKESSSGRTWAYRSAQSSEKDHTKVADVNHGSSSDRARALSPATSARLARQAPTSAGSLVRTEANEATAKSSGGDARSRPARSRSASRRKAIDGAVAGSIIPARTASASSF